MLNIPKHRQIMFDILKDIYTSSVALSLGFKGGTSAYFFYNLDRFSADLDFDLLDETKKDEILAVLQEILKKYGKIKEARDKKYTIFFLLNYQEGESNLKIEVNKHKEYMLEYSFKSFYGTDVLVPSEEDLFGSKLVASLGRDRLAMRDFYDIWFYLKKGVTPNSVLVEHMTKKEFSEYIRQLQAFIKENITSRNILQGLGDVLGEDRK
jgi:predicted nucleotidyltransferase component of viral defense system